MKKKKKKDLKGKDSWKLSARTRLPYMDDDDEDDEEDATRREGRAKDIAPKKSGTGTGTTSGDISEDATASGSGNDEASVSSKARRRGIEANPKITHPPPKLLTKSALKEEERARDHLRKEFYALQERIKATEIAVPFIFYDGTQIPGGMVKVKKGDPIWLFLDRCRKVGARMNIGGANGKRIYRRGWARVSVDDLMLVRKNVIIPHVSGLLKSLVVPFFASPLVSLISLTRRLSITSSTTSLLTTFLISPSLTVCYSTTRTGQRHRQWHQVWLSRTWPTLNPINSPAVLPLTRTRSTNLSWRALTPIPR